MRFSSFLATAGLAAFSGVMAAVVLASACTVNSQEGDPVAKLTPLPFTAYPTPDTTPRPLPTCQFAAEPVEGMPPLSCRNTANEPPASLLTPASPSLAVDPANVPAGWAVENNGVFRFTLVTPPGWYSNMRPEGGEFMLSDPVALEEQLKGSNPPGGVILFFSAHAYRPSSGPFKSTVQEHLDAPTTQFGPYPGAIWDEGPGEGLAHIVWAVFARGEIVYEIRVHVADDGRERSQIQSDLDIANEVLRSITPY